jgi:hypothetical protein
MSGWLVLLVGIIYFIVGIKSLLKGNYAMAVVFISYSVSTIGLYYANN